MSTTIKQAMSQYDWFLNKSKLDYKQYQYDGVKWAVENELNLCSEFNVHGGIISDEMGLGKTMIMIGLLFANCISKTLIVLPNSLIQQWYSEIYRTTGYKPIIYHGIGKKTISVADIEKSHIVLTSYSTVAILKRNIETQKGKCLLHQIQWNRLVFDEAHHLRNRNGRYYGARLLKSKIRWFISGTPIQNNMKDFYSLCSLLRLPASFYTDIEQRSELLKRYMLKRTKVDVNIHISELNKNNKIVLWANEKEKQIAEHIHNELKLTDSKLKFIQYAQKMCILPKMVLGKFGSISIHDLLLNESSKLNFVMKTVIERKNNNAGKIVFCQFYAEIDLLLCQFKLAGFHITNIDGRVNLAERTKRLNNKYDILIIQLQTGCEGLNLQKNYSEVYFVSPTWNPAIELQAIARCHRLGQTKDVHVFKFEMDEFSTELQTMDHYINEVQIKKRLLYL